jgi:hypothetical protein
MEIEIKVETENLMTGNRILTNTAFVTSVALDDFGKPAAVPPLLLVTEDDKKRFAEGGKNAIAKARVANFFRYLLMYIMQYFLQPFLQFFYSVNSQLLLHHFPLALTFP